MPFTRLFSTKWQIVTDELSPVGTMKCIGTIIFQLVFSCEINALGSTYLAQKRRCLVWVFDVARVLYANNPAGNGRA